MSNKTHPMVKSLGKKKFKELLSDLPKHYESIHAGNFKPVTMWLMWLGGDVSGSSVAKSAQMMNEAYNLWVEGLGAEQAVRTVLNKDK